jgi:hypothetical protein
VWTVLSRLWRRWVLRRLPNDSSGQPDALYAVSQPFMCAARTAAAVGEGESPYSVKLYVSLGREAGHLAGGPNGLDRSDGYMDPLWVHGRTAHGHARTSKPTSEPRSEPTSEPTS